MKIRQNMLKYFLLFLSIFAHFSIQQVHAQDQSGFISIDCGLQANSSYTDATTTLNYISDAAFIDSGTIYNVAPGFSTNTMDRQLWNVRSFPEGIRNCYKVSLSKNTKYLIRATFLYGNYDELSELPTFDLHLGPNKWTTVKILNSSRPVNKEIIHIPSLDYIHICLINTGSGTPFISALELRPMLNDIYVPRSGALATFTRLDFGSVTNKTVRYPDDVFDRLWKPDHFKRWTDISTQRTVDALDHIKFQPPSEVMRTASVPTNASEDMEFTIQSEDTSLRFYVYMHFAEIVEREANQTRRFNISLDGENFYGPVIPDYLSSMTVYSETPITGGNYSFSLYKIDNSTLPPLLNAIEIYFSVDVSQLATDQNDVDAITKVKSVYGITKNWQGDPCAPQDFVWDGLNCSYSDISPPKITSLNLSSSGLTGEIVFDISILRSLESLDLSNNNLSGSVPDFLSQLPSLRILNLAGNKLTGTIPGDLYQKSRNGLLLLSVTGNEQLCPSISCKKKKKSIVAPIVASVPGVLVLAVALAVILHFSRRRSSPVVTNEDKIISEKNEAKEPMEAKDIHFSYPEILRITNNFAKVLGKGGFGTVYYGKLDDGTQVAVKILSPSSAQGYKEFHSEVKLLLKVHHRNLTSLVGYCNEGLNMALIYEYMANGNLEDHLSGNNPNVLSWDIRLRIAAEAAQGLEYLHNGCRPQIVHRDVKTTNILLNEKFQAKLSDFGLSRIFPIEGGTHVSTVVAGTPGYLDPEYYVRNWLSEKSDVYSFGVVLLEIITGRPVISKTGEKTHVSDFVSDMLEKGDIKSILDPRLGGIVEDNSAWKFVELAMACVSTTAASRPTMTRVVTQLSECLKIQTARSGVKRNNPVDFVHPIVPAVAR